MSRKVKEMIERKKIEAFIKMADLLAEAKAIYEEIRSDFGICNFAEIQLCPEICPEIGLNAKEIFNKFTKEKELNFVKERYVHESQIITKEETMYKGVRVFVFESMLLISESATFFNAGENSIKINNSGTLNINTSKNETV